MKTTFFSLLMAALVILSAALSAQSMPPHPELMDRIRSGENPVPYFLSHQQELRAAGVNAPIAMRTVERLRQRSLDENINLIAILVDFSDHVSHVTPAFFDTLLFGNQTGTLNDYYMECSYGNLTLTTVHFPGALGWQRAPQTYDYYVNGQNGFGNYPRNAQRLTQDAVQMVDSIVDFSHYDNDGDGYVEGLFIIHSGPGAEFTGNDDDIWSHAWSIRTPIHTDGVTISRYSMEPEYWQQYGDMTCGVFAHEMGHAVFGLPDFYDYGYDSRGLGRWSLMAGGSWGGSLGNSPAHPDAYSRIYMGFVTPTNITEYRSNVPIPSVESSPLIFRLWTNGADNFEYFLLENRQTTGYDASLPAGGLLIYHVDELVDGNDNQWYPGHTGSGHYQVALEQADGLWELEQDISSGDGGDPYPGTTNSTTFSGSSTPNSRSYAGDHTYVSVRNISASSAMMHADFAVGPGPGNPVFAALPDTTAAPGDTVAVTIIIDDVTAQNITSVQFTVSCDSGIVRPAAPYFDPENTLIPTAWIVTAIPTGSTVAITAAGATALTGEGTLLNLLFCVNAAAEENAISPLTFTQITFNQGEPPADARNGSLTVGMPHVWVQPSSLSFGSVAVGDSASRSFIIRNNGSASLLVHEVTPPPCFTTNFSGAATIAPASWLQVRVTFRPENAQPYQESLTVTSNAPESPTSVTLSGIGTGSGISDAPSNGLPSQYALLQNYPNPFNASTSIGLELPRGERVTLRIFDVLGSEVTLLADGFFEAGRYQFAFDGNSLPSGIYFARVEAGAITLTRKLMLLR